MLLWKYGDRDTVGRADFPGLLERAANARAARLANWQREFPANGSQLFADLQARVQAQVATHALEAALS